MNLTKYDKDVLIKAILDDLPERPSAKEIIVEVQNKIVDRMSPACQELYERMPHALATLCAHQITSAYSTVSLVVGDVSEDEFFEITSPYENIQRQYIALTHQLEASFRDVRTAKALLAQFPQFKKYLPAVKHGSDSNTLPDVVDTLVKMGWAPQ